MDINLEYERHWYVLQTVNGLEKMCQSYLEQRIVSLGLQDYIFQVLVPEQTKIVVKKNGEKKEELERIYPGYIFIDMIVNEDTWFKVRNTPLVTGFLGSSGGGTRPIPCTTEEILPVLKQCGIKLEYDLKFKVGDTVEIVSGSFAGQTGVVESIDAENQIVEVSVEFMGRQASQKMRFDEVKAIQ